jgi:hypothetical protein
MTKKKYLLIFLNNPRDSLFSSPQKQNLRIFLGKILTFLQIIEYCQVAKVLVPYWSEMLYFFSIFFSNNFFFVNENIEYWKIFYLLK